MRGAAEVTSALVCFAMVNGVAPSALRSAILSGEEDHTTMRAEKKRTPEKKSKTRRAKAEVARLYVCVYCRLPLSSL
jgi:hypothetical protein